ncbi:MAG: hypothetical protein K5978_01535 [Campylobacter sp.]|nr:hypothetical protein [Campylobacter sp.]
MEQIQEFAYFGLIKKDEFNFFSNKKIKMQKELDFDIKSTQNCALDHFASALLCGVCLAIKSHFKQNNIRLFECEGKMKIFITNPLFYLGVLGYEESSKIQSIKLRIYLSFDGKIENLDDFCKLGVKRSVLYESFKDKIDISFCEVF